MKEKSGYYFDYVLDAVISEANIVEGFVNNSQAKRWHVSGLELFSGADCAL